MNNAMMYDYYSDGKSSKEESGIDKTEDKTNTLEEKLDKLKD